MAYRLAFEILKYFALERILFFSPNELPLCHVCYINDNRTVNNSNNNSAKQLEANKI